MTGRDIEDMQIKLVFERDPPVWMFVGYGGDTDINEGIIIKTLCAFMMKRDVFTGTASELFTVLHDSNAITQSNGITANNITRKIKEQTLTLEKTHNIRVSFSRTNSARLITLQKVTGDSKFTGGILSPVSSDSKSDCGVSFNLPSPVTNDANTMQIKACTGDSVKYGRKADSHDEN